jgi:hypothetical protein
MGDFNSYPEEVPVALDQALNSIRLRVEGDLNRSHDFTQLKSAHLCRLK